MNEEQWFAALYADLAAEDVPYDMVPKMVQITLDAVERCKELEADSVAECDCPACKNG